MNFKIILRIEQILITFDDHEDVDHKGKTSTVQLQQKDQPPDSLQQRKKLAINILATILNKPKGKNLIEPP